MDIFYANARGGKGGGLSFGKASPMLDEPGRYLLTWLAVMKQECRIVDFCDLHFKIWVDVSTWVLLGSQVLVPCWQGLLRRQCAILFGL